MKVRDEQSQEELIQELQRQLDEQTAINRLLADQLAGREQSMAMIAHELRAPLSPIIIYAQMLNRYLAKESDPKRDEAIQRNANVIISQAWKLNRLVNDLHDASRLSVGQFILQRDACNIIQLAQEVIEHLRPLALYHTLVLETSEKSIIGNWDGGRLQQAIGNLVDNAIKYSDEHSTITINISTTSTVVHVSVHNTGISIPAAESEQLFRPYTRLQSTSSTHPGSGLGLYITRSIIEAHGGSLRYEPRLQNDAPTEQEASGLHIYGTTFSFDIPL